MSQQNTFKQYLFNTYDRQELQDIADYGCQSGVAGTMIYYNQTNDLYDKYSEEMHDTLGAYIEETGQIPDYIVKYLGDLVGFKNAMVWFVAEIYAQEMTNTEEA